MWINHVHLVFVVMGMDGSGDEPFVLVCGLVLCKGEGIVQHM